VPGEIHDAHSAPADQRLDAVPGDQRSDPGVAGRHAVGSTSQSGTIVRIALVLRQADRVTAAIAVAALVVSFVAAYERAKGRALGYPIDDSVVTRALRYGLVALGLIVLGWLRGTLIAVLVLAVLSSAVRASQVAKLERE
jgi:hypothetical protein